MTDCTIVIPTYNRSALLHRLLTYYSQESFPHPIIVADSSKPDSSQKNRKTVEKLSSKLRVRYIHFEPSTEIFVKITQAIKEVGSTYVNLCADDDFIVANSLARAIHFLDTHPDYVAVGGRSVVGYIREEKLSIAPVEQRPITEDAGLNRLRQCFVRPSTTIYTAHRTKILRKNLDRLARCRTDNTRFEELAFSSLDAIEGKVGVMESLYAVRQSSGHRPDSGAKETKGWKHVASSPTFEKNKEIFIALLHEAAIESKVDINKDAIEKWFTEYLHKAIASKKGRRSTYWERAVAAALLPSAPTATRKKLQCVLHVALMADSRIRTMQKEFAPIAQLLKKYPDGIL